MTLTLTKFPTSGTSSWILQDLVTQTVTVFSLVQSSSNPSEPPPPPQETHRNYLRGVGVGRQVSRTGVDSRDVTHFFP